LAAFGAQARKGYAAEQGQSPQTVGYPLTDSPGGLAAWMLDHDADSYVKISRAFAGGPPSGGLTRDHIMDNITLYWLTGTATSAARMYWEGARSTAAAAGSPPDVSLPAAFTVFPGEIFQAPRTWGEQVYPNLIYFHQYESEQARSEHLTGAALASLRSALEGKLSSGLDVQVLVPHPAGNARKGAL
jgi:hypothetical protein